MSNENVVVVSSVMGIVVREELDDSDQWNYWFQFGQGMPQLELVPMPELRLTPPQRFNWETITEIAMFVGRVRVDTTTAVRWDIRSKP